MWDIIVALWKHWRNKDKKPTPQPQPEPPKPEPEKPKEPRMYDGYVVPDWGVIGDEPDHKHPSNTATRIHSLDGVKLVKARWNPATSKGRGKVIWPAEYCGKTMQCYWWANEYGAGEMDRQHNHEMWNRERYYAKIPIGSMPSAINIRCETPDGPIGVVVANTREELN